MKKKLLPITLLLILAASIVYFKIQAGEDYLPEMLRMAGQDSEIEHVSGQVYKVLRNGEVIGYIGQESAVGYAGPIDVVVLIDTAGVIKDINVVKQMETPSFFRKVMAEGFVDNLINKGVASRFELGDDVDEIANATYTTKAITQAVCQVSHNIAEAHLNMDVPKTAAYKLPPEHYLVMGLLLAVFVIQKFKWLKLRYLTFLTGFILIGYWQKSLITLGNFSSVLAGNISLHNIPFWFVLLLGILLLVIISGRNLYCFWICPYGAISEVLGAFGRFGRMNYSPCAHSIKRYRNLRLFLAWGALVFAFLMLNPSISSYEIFAPLFAWEGTSVQWLMLPIILFAGVFVLRFWCRLFCPVGGILDLLVTWRRSCVQWLGNIMKKDKLKQEQQEKA